MQRLCQFPLCPLLGLMVCVMTGAASAADFALKSADLEHGQPIARAFVLDDHGCGGDNVSPALHWSAGPAATKAYAVSVHDPDAPRAGGWWHWIVHDLPAGVRSLDRGASGNLPGGGVEAANDFGFRGYGGPCPPPGDTPHRYVFTVYALDTATIELPSDSKPAVLVERIQRHALARARLVARYGR